MSPPCKGGAGDGWRASEPSRLGLSAAFGGPTLSRKEGSRINGLPRLTQDPSVPPPSARGVPMRLRLSLLAAAAFLAAPALAEVEKPAAIVADGIPAVPDELAERTRPYMEFRTAGLQGWNPAQALARRSPPASATPPRSTRSPGRSGCAARSPSRPTPSPAPPMRAGMGDVLVVQKDVGGSEFWQLYVLDNGRLQLLTDGKSRNASTPGAMTAAGSPTPRPAATAPTTTSTSSIRATRRATGCSPRSRAAAGAWPISRPTGGARSSPNISRSTRPTSTGSTSPPAG